LGFSGFTDLQRLFRAPLQQAVQPSYRERIRHYGGELTLERPEDPAAVLRAFSQANIVSLQHLQADADALPLREAIGMLQGARLVHVIGLRRSYAVAAYLAYALNRIGRSAIHITAQGGMVAEQALAAGPKDVVVAISFPPYAADTLQVCDQIKAQGASLLAISNGVLSPLGSSADLLLDVNDAELKGFRSLTSALCLVQTLVMGIAFGQRHRARKKAGAKPSPDLVDIDC
jgi:DNA-binding MurR/RpiR family transcriptional regulator